jgi:hypothetical protein
MWEAVCFRKGYDGSKDDAKNTNSSTKPPAIPISEVHKHDETHGINPQVGVKQPQKK